MPGLLGFWEQARGESVEGQVGLWEEYVAANPDLVNDVTRMGERPDPRKALERYPELESRIQQNAPLISGWITEAADLVVPALEAGDVEVPCVALVGFVGSNGWVSEVEGGHTLFLAIEQTPAQRAAQILAMHEIAHPLQFPLPEKPWPEDGALGHGIYAEGFATALTAGLLPAYGLAEHLWFGPGYDDWLVECERVLPETRAAILADLDSEDQAVIGRYLALWPELARWSTDRAMTEIRQVLER